ncbi:tetratricopeptide repeat protein [bacterium]|nr:tetratricopeptide repeat protein [bacterium]
MTDEKIFAYIKQAFDLKNEKCYKQAVEMLYKAIEIENDNEEVIFQIGELYFLMHDYKRAENYLEQVLKKNPAHIQTLRLLKDISKIEGKYEKALKYAQKLLEIEKNPKNIISAIEIYKALKDEKQILQFSDCEDIEVKEELARAFYEFGNLEEAQKYLSQILSENPENENALLISGKISFDQGDLAKSRDIFDKIKYDTENPEILNYIGLFAMEDLKFTDAIQNFSKAASIDKTNHKYFYNLANAYFLNGWMKEAANAYLQAIRLDDDNADYRYSLAYLYYKTSEFSKAQNEVNYILSLDENHYKTRCLEALLKFEEKDYLGAQNILENNIKLGFDDDFTKLSLAKVYKELFNYEKAAELLNEISAKNPQGNDYKYELADLYYREKNIDKTYNTLKDIIAQNEDYIKAYPLLCACELDKKNFEEAKLYAQKAISLDMNFAPSYYYLALVREEENDYDEAIECMKRAILLDLNNAFYYAKTSDLYAKNKNYDYAFEYIKEAAELDNSSLYKSKFAQLAAIKRKNN